MAETKARFLADTQKADTTAEAFTWPTGRASQNNYVLAMSDKTTGETAWQVTSTAPTITGITSGQLNSYYDADGTTVSNDKGGTLVIGGTDFGTDIGSITAVRICDSNGTSQIDATTLASLSDTSITATWNGTESGYSTFSGVYYVEIMKSGMLSNRFNSTKSFSGDPTISSVTGTGGEGDNVTVTASNLGSYGGTVAGGGQDSNTKLLLNFDRIGGTDIEDSSNVGGDGHKVTASGDATIKASPFGDGKTAMFFNGSSDKVSKSSAGQDFNFGTASDPWTIEFWANNLGGSSSYGFVTMWSGTKRCWSVQYGDANTTVLGLANGNGSNVQGTAVASTITSSDIGTGVWHHYAVVNDGTNISFYLDGVAKGSGSSVVCGGPGGEGATLEIGAWSAGAGYFNGYMDEIRIVKGSAVYTGDFIVPTSRLTAIDNTKLLIHSNQSYNEADNLIPITLNGLSMTTTNARTAWGGSAWDFDGTNDYAFTTPSTDFDLGKTYDWTLECWIRVENKGDWDRIVSLADKDDFGGWALHLDGTSSSHHMLFGDDNETVNISGGASSVPDEGSWNHYAVVHDDTADTLTMYKDGVQVGQTTSASTTNWNYDATNRPVLIGARSSSGTTAVGGYSGTPTNFFDGMIEDLRIVVGTKVYTGAFNNSLPSGPLTKTGGSYTQGSDIANVNQSFPASNTKLLVHGDGAKFTDSSDGASDQSTAHDITPTGSYHSQAHGGISPALTFPASGKLTGSAGIYFDGTNDNLSVPASTDWAFSTGNFTVDFWLYVTENPANEKGLVGNHVDDSVVTNWKIKLDANGKVFFSSGNNNSGSSDSLISSSAVTLGAWNHIAFSRSGSTLTCYLNGATSGTVTNNQDYSLSQALYVGYAYRDDSGGDSYLTGYIDCLRIVKGTAHTFSAKPTQIYGAMFPTNPSVGTITITGATTDSTDIAFTEINNSLPNGLTLNDQGAGNQTATITGTLTDVVGSDTTTNNIRIQAKANNDDKRITEVNESNGVGAVSITKKAGGAPVLFSARRYAGNSSERDIDFGLKPDFVWIKKRNEASNHALFDSVRGDNHRLMSDDTTAERATSLYGGVNFGNNTLIKLVAGSDASHTWSHTNLTSKNYVAWAWKAGGAPTVDNSGGQTPTSGSKMIDGSISTANFASADIYPTRQSINTTGDFSITEYVGTSTTTDQELTVPHGLSGTPDFVIIKNLDSAVSWTVWTPNITSGYLIRLDIPNAEDNPGTGIVASASSTTVTTESTSTNGNNVNQNNVNYIMYAWKGTNVTGGANVSAFGTYSGTGSSAHYRTIGFVPSLLMIKRLNASGSWMMLTNILSAGTTTTTQVAYDPDGDHRTLYADLTGGESSGTFGNVKTYISGSNKGFELSNSNTESNASDGEYIYMAFA